MIRRTHTFRWKNFAGRKNSSRRTSRLRSFVFKNGILRHFGIICVLSWKVDSIGPEIVGDEIRSYSIHSNIQAQLFSSIRKIFQIWKFQVENFFSENYPKKSNFFISVKSWRHDLYDIIYDFIHQFHHFFM